MATEENQVPARVVLAASCLGDAVAALDLAAPLAHHLRRELVGLLIEEEAVHFHASMPFARTVAVPGQERKEITAEKMRHAFDRDAREFQNLLRRLGEKENLRWSFRTVRQKIRFGSDGETSTEDFVILGGQVSHSHRTAVLAVFGSHPDQGLANLAAKVAHDTERPLVAFVAENGTSDKSFTPHFPPTIPVKILTYQDGQDLIRLIGRTGSAALLISTECREACDLDRLVEAARCPVLVAAAYGNGNS